jgi:hypothetical protein
MLANAILPASFGAMASPRVALVGSPTIKAANMSTMSVRSRRSSGSPPDRNTPLYPGQVAAHRLQLGQARVTELQRLRPEHAAEVTPLGHLHDHRQRRRRGLRHRGQLRALAETEVVPAGERDALRGSAVLPRGHRWHAQRRGSGHDHPGSVGSTVTLSLKTRWRQVIPRAEKLPLPPAAAREQQERSNRGRFRPTNNGGRHRAPRIG